MKKQVLHLKNKKIEYCIRKNKLAKRVNLRLTGDGRLIVTIPNWAPYKIGEKFIDSRKSWIEKNLAELEKKKRPRPQLKREDYLYNKEAARYFVYKKLEQFNHYYNFKYQKIHIKDQKSRWGSCSSKSNLNFSYKIVFLPEHLADYIIVHELCHLGELSHSSEFWRLVEKVIPDHKERRRELRKYMF